MLAFHVSVSLLAMIACVWCFYGLVANRLSATAVTVFLVTHAVTSLTGFPLPPFGFDPPRAVGILSLLALVVAATAYYAKAAMGTWRWIFTICVFFAGYLNLFVGVTQAFQKSAPLRALAPHQTELPFVAAHLGLLVVVVALAVVALRQFGRPPHRPLSRMAAG